jgi:hypothetical protein
MTTTTRRMTLKEYLDYDDGTDTRYDRTYAKAVKVSPLAPNPGGTESPKAPRFGGWGANA